MEVLSLVILLFFRSPLFGQTPGQTKSTDTFERFYAQFRQVVKKRDRGGLKELMSARFQWALDGHVSRDQALKNIDRIVGWEKFWLSAQKAVGVKAEPCKPPYCEGRAGFHVWAKSPFPLEMMFERDPGGKWRWSAVLGD